MESRCSRRSRTNCCSPIRGFSVAYDLDPNRDIFTARISAIGTALSGSLSGSSRQCETYAWTEVEPDPAGCGYITAQFPRTGTTTREPAFGLCGNTYEVGDVVFMRLRGWNTVYRGRTYEIISGCDAASDGSDSGSGSTSNQNYIDVVTNVCLIDSSASGSTSLSVGTP